MYGEWHGRKTGSGNSTQGNDPGTQGMLMIRGQELHMNRLTLEKGEVDIEGKIDSFVYSEQKGENGKDTSFLGRLFR